MLTKRTNILFDQQTWDILTALAQRENNSVAELVRKAVKRTYFSEGKRLGREKAFKRILSSRRKFKGKIDYRELIEHGRKY